jgi:hypothetical protein
MTGGLARGALLVLAAYVGEAHAATTAYRYLCQLTDGSTAVVAYDLSAQYGGSVARCTPVETPLATVEPMPVRPVPDGAAGVSGAAGGGRAVASRAQPQLMPSPYAAMIRDAAQRYRVEPRLLMAVAQVESRHRADARSPKGALGIMQVMPSTGARYGVAQSRNLYDPEVNVDVAARYLSDLLDMFGRVDLALAAYNAGEGTVTRYGNRVPPFPETRQYVRRVMELSGRSR